MSNFVSNDSIKIEPPEHEWLNSEINKMLKKQVLKKQWTPALKKTKKQKTK